MQANKLLATPVFIISAYEDKSFRQTLEDHLTALKLSGRLTVIGERETRRTLNWAEELSPELAHAAIILILLSPDLVGSGYLSGIEFQQVTERHKTGKARILPILLRPIDLQSTFFQYLQRIPMNGIAISRSQDPDEAWSQVTTALRRIISSLNHS